MICYFRRIDDFVSELSALLRLVMVAALESNLKGSLHVIFTKKKLLLHSN